MAIYALKVVQVQQVTESPLRANLVNQNDKIVGIR
jgi:hypothetical protein